MAGSFLQPAPLLPSSMTMGNTAGVSDAVMPQLTPQWEDQLYFQQAAEIDAQYVTRLG